MPARNLGDARQLHSVGRARECRARTLPACRARCRRHGSAPPGEGFATSFVRDAGETIYDPGITPWHYVPVLARKPGALRNGAPFKDWVLPIRSDNRSYLRELNGRMF